MSIEKKYIFFLGGADAERQEIKNILVQHNLPFHDKEPPWWDANASTYNNELNNLHENEITLLIELTIDIALPSKAIIVDHHNEKAGFDKKFIQQAKEARRIREADFAILVTNAFPSKKQFYFVEKSVFVISPISLEPITYTLRESLLRMAII